jgi:hypothetical protein
MRRIGVGPLDWFGILVVVAYVSHQLAAKILG